MSHTLEPWVVDDYIEWNIKANGVTLASSSLLNFSKDEYTANARRIVACVNACAGVTDGDLQQIAQAGGWQSISEQWKQQHDELLALIAECDQYLDINNLTSIGHGSILHRKLKDAAKARGQHD